MTTTFSPALLTDSPPKPLLTDRLELYSLLLVFALGAPMNLGAWVQQREKPTISRLDLLKKHLNHADLTIIFVYVPSRICWILTYDWRGGDMLCKVVKFMHTFSFQASSNIIVCIAIDRLFSILCDSYKCPTRGKNRTRKMLFIAWLLAVIISFPQILVWKNFLVFPDHRWYQCMTIWEVARHERKAKDPRLFDLETFYSIAHICLVFWIPAVIIAISYVSVLSWVWVNSRSTNKANPIVQRRSGGSFGGETAETLLTRASEWNPLRNLSISKHLKDSTDGKGIALNTYDRPPQIIVLDDSNEPLTRPSITPSEASAVIRTNVHTSQSYSASVTRARAFRISCLLIVAYIVCWFPYNFLSLLRLLDQHLFKKLVDNLYFAQQLMVFTAVLNPYLYGQVRITCTRC
ncbi:unnamed protein product [Auanema sp. JU1783]|nr:unnamed protein product [Auanema sp. JU1783]